ncbi:PP2C family protein-serine/threonine phosphatase, partial [Kitasatospora sp. MBT63]
RPWRQRWAHVAVMASLPVGLLVVDELTPPDIRLGPLMVAAPPLAAAFCSPGGVLIVTAVMFPCVILSGRANGQLGTPNFPVQLATILLICLAALAASGVRQRRERQLARSRSAVEVLQHTLLRPPPTRIGPLDLACLYLTADEESSVGGDLYAATVARGRVRILLGDAQGKGLAALGTAGQVLGSFRRASRHHARVEDLVAEVEDDLREELRAAAAEAGPGAADDGFVTAVFLDLPADGGGPVRLANLGHPPPLLLDAGGVTALDPAVATPPLGLGDLAGPRPAADAFGLPPGATLLLYTDGVIEARNRAGEFYPLADRLRQWLALSPAALLEAVHGDLRHHVGARLADDVAMVAIRRTAPPGAAG